MTKISLHGFNNLTKSLSFSIYKLHYLNDNQAHHEYNDYINKLFCADNLTILLTKICHAIGGNVLNIAKQDYEPQGASVTLMISEEAQPESLVAHLDKSHLCIHTYPEDMPQNNIAIFRADIELSTCGVISPLSILEYIINKFDADVADIDYRIRGMTRNKHGKKQYKIDNIEKISDYIPFKTLSKFTVAEHSFTEQNLFHLKLAKNKLDLTNHLFDIGKKDLTEDKLRLTNDLLMREIYALTNNI